MVKAIVSVDAILAEERWDAPWSMPCHSPRPKNQRLHRVPENIYTEDRFRFNREEFVGFHIVQESLYSARLSGTNQTAFTPDVSLEKIDHNYGLVFALIAGVSLAFAIYQFLSNSLALLTVSVFVFSFFQMLLSFRKS